VLFSVLSAVRHGLEAVSAAENARKNAIKKKPCHAFSSPGAGAPEAAFSSPGAGAPEAAFSSPGAGAAPGENRC